MNFKKLLLYSAFSIALLGCSKSEIIKPVNTPSDAKLVMKTDGITVSLTEDFESGTKTSYATADVALGSGSWNLNDALIGTSSSDRKNGSKSIRVRNTGIVSMNFDVSSGASTVTVNHAVYGSDGASSWELWVSANGGSTYSKVGATVTSSSTSLQSASFTVNLAGNLRFQIRKTSGGSNRINFDDFTVNSYDTGTTSSGFVNESFDDGSKGSYASADITLPSGSWNLNDALIGSSTSDVKNGTKSVRIRNTGTLSMNFDVTGGVTDVSISHAVYGSDGSSTWELWMSTNGGTLYSKVGATITTSSSSLQTETFSLNETGDVRFQIRKTSGGSNRINIDDFIISGSGSSGSGGTGGSGGGTGGTGGTDTGGSSSSTADNTNLLLGNPSAATSSITDPSNYLIDQTYYTESYNRDKGTPNWVSWYIGSSSLGSAARQNDFRADTNLPSGWYQVQSTSYSGSGFDRGHNCPSADRTSTTTANSATFLMDNMIPQAPNNNQHTWANMENYIRSLVTAGNEVYVVMGSYGTGGTGSNGTFNTIDNGHVNVPSHVWKVVVVIPNGNGDISRINTSTRVIAVDTPNINTVNSDWTVYKTSVDAIEAATGYNLLSNVPASVQAVIEAHVDNQ